MSGPAGVLAIMKRDAEHAEAYWIAHGVSGGSPHAMAQESKQAIAYASELIDSAKSASATLGHAYHTVLCGELGEQAHTEYQRLDAAIANAEGTHHARTSHHGVIECRDAKGFWLILSGNAPFVHGQKVIVYADSNKSCAIGDERSLEAFDRWWAASKYMQLVFSDDHTKQAAKDGFYAALASFGGAA